MKDKAEGIFSSGVFLMHVYIFCFVSFKTANYDCEKDREVVGRGELTGMELN